MIGIPGGPGGGQRRSLDERAPLSESPMVEAAEIQIRHGFIQKVYGILITQLSITLVISSLIVHLGRRWVVANPNLATTMICLGSVGSLLTMFVFICCPGAMRRSPTNYFLLFLFTICKSLLVGFISLAYTRESVIIALAITALIVISLTAFACQTSYDFTGYGPYLMCGLMCLICLGFTFFIASLVGLGNSPAFKTLRLVYAAGGAFLFSCYIVFDTQLIIGGKHNRYRFSIDDYAMAAINLYVDIVQLFLFLLELIGKRR